MDLQPKQEKKKSKINVLQNYFLKSFDKMEKSWLQNSQFLLLHSKFIFLDKKWKMEKKFCWPSLKKNAWKSKSKGKSQMQSHSKFEIGNRECGSASPACLKLKNIGDYSGKVEKV